MRRKRELMSLGIEEAMALTLSLNEHDWQQARARQQRPQATVTRQAAARKAAVLERRQLVAAQDKAFAASKACDAKPSQDKGGEGEGEAVPPPKILPKGRRERAAFYETLYSRTT